MRARAILRGKSEFMELMANMDPQGRGQLDVQEIQVGKNSASSYAKIKNNYPKKQRESIIDSHVKFSRF